MMIITNEHMDDISGGGRVGEYSVGPVLKHLLIKDCII